MARSKGDASLSRRGEGFTVPASPFNAVKLDLALLIIVGVVLWLVHDRLITDQFGQFVLLSGYGLTAMCWIVFRTRRTARRLADLNAGEEMVAVARDNDNGLGHGEK